jgi:hypothetical protein
MAAQAPVEVGMTPEELRLIAYKSIERRLARIEVGWSAPETIDGVARKIFADAPKIAEALKAAADRIEELEKQ